MYPTIIHPAIHPCKHTTYIQIEKTLFHFITNVRQVVYPFSRFSLNAEEELAKMEQIGVITKALSTQPLL